MAARYGREVKTIGHAWREFSRKRSPRIFAAGIVALAARIAVGDWGWWDLALGGGMLLVYPFGEWAIHVYLLHLKPFTWRGRRVELVTAKSHRMHHEKPNALWMILLAPVEALTLIGLAVPLVAAVEGGAVALFAGEFPVAASLTAVFAGIMLVGIYEWTHFLIHTAYRPRSRWYRAIWRGHRLHHFKNERYWHGITNTIADRVLGTNPEQADVPRSRTARTLEA